MCRSCAAPLVFNPFTARIFAPVLSQNTNVLENNMREMQAVLPYDKISPATRARTSSRPPEGTADRAAAATFARSADDP